MLRLSLGSPLLVVRLAGLVLASLLILGACAPLPGPAVELTPSLEPAAPTPVPLTGASGVGGVPETPADAAAGLPVGQAFVDLSSNGAAVPHWVLSAGEVEHLKTLLDRLPPIECPPIAEPAGYRGIVVVLSAGDQGVRHAYGGWVWRGSPAAMNPQTTCQLDPGREVERFLLNGAQPYLDPGVFSAVAAEMNRPLRIPLVTPSPTPTAAPEACATAAGQGNVAAVPTLDVALPAQDAGRIVFESRSATGEDLFSVKPDGADLRQITRDPGLNQEPACSPDGQRIAFTSWRGNTHYLYLLNADGSQERQLAGGPGNVAEPAWSPDGRQIVFSSEADKAFYVINADGTGQERLPVTGDNLYAPAWSPDGQRLAYTSYARNAWDLHIARLDGSGDTNLTGGRAFYAHQAAWSPNGTQIAFYGTLGDGKTFEIYVMNADGSGVRRLTTPPDDDSWRNNGRPAWSPDGTRIAFHSDRGSGFDIWIMNADGSEQKQLTHGLNASNPCWLPGR